MCTYISMLRYAIVMKWTHNNNTNHCKGQSVYLILSSAPQPVPPYVWCKATTTTLHSRENPRVWAVSYHILQYHRLQTSPTSSLGHLPVPLPLLRQGPLRHHAYKEAPPISAHARSLRLLLLGVRGGVRFGARAGKTLRIVRRIRQTEGVEECSDRWVESARFLWFCFCVRFFTHFFFTWKVQDLKPEKSAWSRLIGYWINFMDCVSYVLWITSRLKLLLWKVEGAGLNYAREVEAVLFNTLVTLKLHTTCKSSVRSPLGGSTVMHIATAFSFHQCILVV